MANTNASPRALTRSATIGALALLTLSCRDSNGPELPPVDDRIIAFSTTEGNSHGLSIFLMHADGTSHTRVTSDGFVDDNAVWSPDGSTIGFDTNRDPGGIWLVDANGANIRPFITVPDFMRPVELSWSPNGSKVAFTALLGIQPFIFVANADGSNAHQLLSPEGSGQSPAWSPDGSKIAFESTGNIGGTHIFVVGADGTGIVQLTNAELFDTRPRWSPNGRLITFNRTALPAPTQIFEMNADGSNQHALTMTEANFGAAWSPDGQQLAVTVLRNNNNQISRMNADGSDVRLITTAGTNAFPAWKPAP